MKALFLALALAAVPAMPLHAQQVVPKRSEIAFTSKQMGVPVNGRFGRFDARVVFDPDLPEAATIGFTIDLASVSLGTAEVEAEIAKPEWFDTKHFPQASFASRSIRATGPGRYEVSGSLTIKGRQQDVVVPVTLTRSGASATASGSFVIRRLEFGIGDGDWNDTSLVADDVRVRFSLALTGLPRPAQVPR
jgi:polyisoprenoid-binding protein YceI